MTYWCSKCEKFVGKNECRVMYSNITQEECIEHNSCYGIVGVLNETHKDRLTVKRSTKQQALLISILLISSIFDALRDCTISYPIEWWTWHTVKWISAFSVWIYLWFQIKNSSTLTTWIVRVLVAFTSYVLWEIAYKLGPSILQ